MLSLLYRTLSEGTLGKRTALVLYACLDRLCSADKADDWKVGGEDMRFLKL
jgi:hypothetical protein